MYVLGMYAYLHVYVIHMYHACVFMHACMCVWVHVCVHGDGWSQCQVLSSSVLSIEAVSCWTHSSQVPTCVANHRALWISWVCVSSSETIGSLYACLESMCTTESWTLVLVLRSVLYPLNCLTSSELFSFNCVSVVCRHIRVAVCLCLWRPEVIIECLLKWISKYYHILIFIL